MNAGTTVMSSLLLAGMAAHGFVQPEPAIAVNDEHLPYERRETYHRRDVGVGPKTRGVRDRSHRSRSRRRKARG